MADEGNGNVLRYRMDDLKGDMDRLSIDVQENNRLLLTLPRFTPEQHRALVGLVDTMAIEAIAQRDLRRDIRNTLVLIAGTVILSPAVVIIAQHFFP